jgi:phospholipase C
VASFDGVDWNGMNPPLFNSMPAATFLSDVVNGLPMFSLIEPRYNMQSSTFSGTPGDLLPTCAHPGFANLPLPSLASSKSVNAPSDAASADLLVMTVYNLLQASPNWATTLFIVTFDEPGGTFDHVPPRACTAPGAAFPAAKSDADPAANGFDWTVLGGRVPAIIISPLVKQGSRVRAHTPFDHTSIIKTVWEAFDLNEGSVASLTDRDAAAPSLVPFCNATNDTGPFSGTIVCAPSALVFTGSASLMFYASGGTTQLSASMPNQPSWVTAFTPVWNASTNQLGVTVTVDATNASGVQTATFDVTGSGLTTVPVTVTLSV